MAGNQTIPVRRLANTLVALGVTIGIVMLVRWCIREAVLGHTVVHGEFAPAASPVERAEKLFDLGKLIPSVARITVMGVSASASERKTGMPYDVAEESSAAEAESLGWELKTNDSLADMLASFAGQRVYLTPTGEYVCRRLIAVRGDETVVKDFRFPANELEAGASEATTINELETVRGYQVINALPSPIKETIVGMPALTQLMPRNEGHAYIIRTVTPTTVAMTKKDLERTLASAPGWKKQENLSEAWNCGNLSLMTEVRERTGSPGAEIVYRFSDDEVYLTKKGTQE